MWFPVCTICKKSRAWSQYSDFTHAKDLPISVKIEWFFAETTDSLINIIYIHFFIYRNSVSNFTSAAITTFLFLPMICGQKCWLFVNIYFGTSKESHFEKKCDPLVQLNLMFEHFFYACFWREWVFIGASQALLCKINVWCNTQFQSHGVKNITHSKKKYIYCMIIISGEMLNWKLKAFISFKVDGYVDLRCHFGHQVNWMRVIFKFITNYRSHIKID